MATLPITNDPRDLLLGDDNDLVITNGDLSFTRSVDAVAQDCRIAVQMFQDEWFLNLDAGIPYWEQILGHKPPIAVAAMRVAIRRELLAVSGVERVLRLEVGYDPDTRTLEVTWQVQTGSGDTPPDSIAIGVP